MGLLSLAALFFSVRGGHPQTARAPFLRGKPAILRRADGGLLHRAYSPVPVLGSGASPILGYLISATYAVKRLNAGEG